MVFQIKKVSDHGAANPIVARLTFQTHELIQFCSIKKDVKDKVVELYYNRIQRVYSGYLNIHKFELLPEAERDSATPIRLRMISNK